VQGCGPQKPSTLYQLLGMIGFKLTDSSLNTTHNPARKNYSASLRFLIGVNRGRGDNEV